MHQLTPVRGSTPAVCENLTDEGVPPWQELPLAVGTLARARGRLARVVSIQRHERCAAVGLRFADRPTHLVLLTPFDRVRPAGGGGRWVRSQWTAVVSAFGRAAASASGFRAAGRLAELAPTLHFLDWQLEPARVLHEGRASRVLIADAVGLGKTVQAAWALLAVCDPSRARVLVLTPAGLRDQWRSELERLFGIEATTIDAAQLRGVRSGIPSSINPWSVPGVFISAIDFAKQPEVLARLLDRRWSLLVVDEAHNLGPGTDRRRAADLLALRADHVALLTATPHAGDSAAFVDLCRVGAVRGDELEIIRRTRADVGLASRRRIVTLAVRPTAAERRLHEELRWYVKRLRRGTQLDPETRSLLRFVLLKRAASSSHALLRSLVRRRSALAGIPAEPVQEALPFDDVGDLEGADDWMPDVLDAPALANRRAELAALDALIACAAEAAEADSKLHALRRLLRRVRQPALVFTEYRDTLEALSRALAHDVSTVLLHGGLTRSERRDAVRAFRSGAARLLLATDAAGEGLNLHHTCRLVVNLDVPWNPNRLEQRTGRVDRIGQQRTVHVVTLTGQAAIDRALAARFQRRQRRIRDEIDPFARRNPVVPAAGERVTILAAAAALLRAAAVRRNRKRTGVHPTRAILPFAEVQPSLRRRLQLPGGVLLLYRATLMSVRGAPVASTAVPVMIPLGTDVVRRVPRRRLLRACERAGRSAARERAAIDLEAPRRAHLRRMERLRVRLEASLEEMPDALQPLQAGLFDRRAMTAALRQRTADDERRRELREALDEAAALAQIEGEPRIRPIAALVLR
ncbi:MAG TPA: helicase-related protein [Vicinamibacterales bacterium]|nr:helicase-related protein [Vicinamibacterales bacterium]